MGAGAVAIAAASLIALGVAFDDAELTDYQLKLWDLAIKSVGALGAIGGVARYLYERRQELRWQKTRFIVELFQAFDEDADYQAAKGAVDLAGIVPEAEDLLARVLGHPEGLNQSEMKLRSSIDRYLDFFDRLYTYVFMTKTLTRDDVSSFWGYVIDIRNSPAVSRFALDWGYEDVIRLADKFDEAATARETLIGRRLSKYTPAG